VQLCCPVWLKSSTPWQAHEAWSAVVMPIVYLVTYPWLLGLQTLLQPCFVQWVCICGRYALDVRLMLWRMGVWLWCDS
jgi:hypothetical protein